MANELRGRGGEKPWLLGSLSFDLNGGEQRVGGGSFRSTLLQWCLCRSIPVARATIRLSAVEVKGIGRKGMYHDGGGLHLPVSAREREALDFSINV